MKKLDWTLGTIENLYVFKRECGYRKVLRSCSGAIKLFPYFNIYPAITFRNYAYVIKQLKKNGFEVFCVDSDLTYSEVIDALKLS